MWCKHLARGATRQQNQMSLTRCNQLGNLGPNLTYLAFRATRSGRGREQFCDFWGWGESEARQHVIKIAKENNSRKCIIWLCGHSRSAALMSHAGLACSRQLAGVILFRKARIVRCKEGYCICQKNRLHYSPERALKKCCKNLTPCS